MYPLDIFLTDSLIAAKPLSIFYKLEIGKVAMSASERFNMFVTRHPIGTWIPNVLGLPVYRLVVICHFGLQCMMMWPTEIRKIH